MSGSLRNKRERCKIQQLPSFYCKEFSKPFRKKGEKAKKEREDKGILDVSGMQSLDLNTKAEGLLLAEVSPRQARNYAGENSR